MDMESLHGYGNSNNKVIEDLVHSYTVSSDGNISAGDLCEFINGQIRKTFLSSETNVKTNINAANSSFSSAVLLDDIHVLVNYNTTCLYAVLLTVNGATINIGTPLQINSRTSTHISSTIIDNSRVLVTYCDYSVNYYLWGVILTVSNDTITIGTLTQLNTSASYYINIIRLDSNRALVSYQNGSNNNYLYSAVLSISGTTITPGSFYQINSAGISFPTGVILDSNRVLLCYNASAIVLTISGTSISTGSVYSINSASCVCTSLVLLDSNRALLSYQNGGTSPYPIQSVVVFIDGNIISFGNVYTINNVIAYSITSLLLDSNHVLLGYTNTSSRYMYAVVLTINSAIITIGTLTQINSISTTYTSAILLNSMTVLMVGTTNSYAYSLMLGINITDVSQIIVSHNKKVHVIASALANSGDTIKCYLKGLIKGLSGLIPNNTYYCDDNGKLTLIQTRSGEKSIGVALSSTELLVDKAFWER